MANMGIAERNEEINRRRMERAKAGNGGQAKVPPFDPLTEPRAC